MASPQKPANENNAPGQETNAPATAEAANKPEAPVEVTMEEQLHDEIARLNEELARVRDQWVRAVAETDNIRKRAQRDQDEMSRYAVTGFSGDMVSVLENLMRAYDSIPESERKGTLAVGIDLTLKELLATFQKYGINRIDPQGTKFDHNLHQAVAQVERNDIPPGMVVQVVQAGYVIHDRLLRPAMVTVSKQGEPPKKVDTTA